MSQSDEDIGHILCDYGAENTGGLMFPAEEDAQDDEEDFARSLRHSPGNSQSSEVPEDAAYVVAANNAPGTEIIFVPTPLASQNQSQSQGSPIAALLTDSEVWFV